MQTASSGNNLHDMSKPIGVGVCVGVCVCVGGGGGGAGVYINLSSTEFAHSVPNLNPDKQF